MIIIIIIIIIIRIIRIIINIWVLSWRRFEIIIIIIALIIIIIAIIINITSIALKSSGAGARKRNKTNSLIIFKSRGTYRGHHHQCKEPPGEKSNFEEIRFEIFSKRGKTFTRF